MEREYYKYKMEIGEILKVSEFNAICNINNKFKYKNGYVIRLGKDYYRYSNVKKELQSFIKA